LKQTASGFGFQGGSKLHRVAAQPVRSSYHLQRDATRAIAAPAGVNGIPIAARLLLNGNDVERGISALIKTEVSIPPTVEH
jgi:hypothetical protein